MRLGWVDALGWARKWLNIVDMGRGVVSWLRIWNVQSLESTTKKTMIDYFCCCWCCMTVCLIYQLLSILHFFVKSWESQQDHDSQIHTFHPHFPRGPPSQISVPSLVANARQILSSVQPAASTCVCSQLSPRPRPNDQCVSITRQNIWHGM
jgi:hypothetical protein